jgi:hypothetical protein
MNRATLGLFSLAIAVLPQPAFAQAATPDGIFQRRMGGPQPSSHRRLRRGHSNLGRANICAQIG